MKDSFVNRLAMFQTCLRTLNSPEHKTVWFEQRPVIFTTKVRQATEAVAELEELGRKQEADTKGAAQDKQREEAEMVDAAHVFGSTLAIWFRDQSDEQDAAQVDLSPSAWRALRNQQFLEKARLTRDLGQAVVAGPQAEEAAAYGITAEEIERLGKEIEDYANVITAPQQGIAERKARTGQLGDRFSEVSGFFDVLDKLVLQFQHTPEGRDFVAAYQTSRVVRDLGRSGTRTQPQEPELVAAAE